MSERLDEVARALALPLPRRRVLRLLGGAVVGGAAVPVVVPSRARARPVGPARTRMVGHVVCETECPGTVDTQLCNCDRSAQFPNNPAKPCYHTCCAKGDICCCDPRTGGGVVCCPPGWTCDTNGPACHCASAKCGGACCTGGKKCCASTQMMPQSSCYDPATQCCSPVAGVIAKRPMAKADWCPDRKPKPGHQARANGCGPENGVKVPDSPYGSADFKPACDYHDICYETCRVSKEECDNGFLDRMLKECGSRYGGSGANHAGCTATAHAYFEAVAGLGDSAYEAAQQAACESCC